MEKSLRSKFNQHFSEEKYINYLKQLDSYHPGEIDFRIAETPVFIPKDFSDKMIDTCEEITNLIVSDKFISLTENAIPKDLLVPNENKHPHFIAFDFGICKNKEGELEPQLIEMQGFPTIFGFQIFLDQQTKEYASIPENHNSYFNGYTHETYISLLKEIILGNEKPENVILLEVFPKQQKTRIDFYFTEDLTGIKTVCITELISIENKLYYKLNGQLTQIKRIYNRIIFDDLQQQTFTKKTIDLKHPWDVTWVTHPNWFYRISKYTLPLIRNNYVPKTFYLNEITQLPDNLNDYVLKPLFSFAGMGVIIDIQEDDINSIKDPENWILQEKVHYADSILTPDTPAKAEIRIFYFWKEGWERPKAVHNLVRLSKGKMIGTRYNKDKTWVGGNIAYFEQ